MRRRLRLAFEFARSVEPRSLPSRRDLYADAALAVLIVLAARLTSHSGGNPLPLLLAAALLASRRLFPLAACLLLVVEVLVTRYKGAAGPDPRRPARPGRRCWPSRRAGARR